MDDEPGFTRLLKIVLEKTGRYEVSTENDELQALATATEFKPDVILLDLVMPKLDGGRLARQMKDHAELHNTPILFLSAAVWGQRGRPAQIAGFPAIPKPIGLAELVRAIDSNLPVAA